MASLGAGDLVGLLAPFGRQAARAECWSTWFAALSQHPRVRLVGASDVASSAAAPPSATHGGRASPSRAAVTAWVLYAEASFDLDWPSYERSGRNWQVQRQSRTHRPL